MSISKKAIHELANNLIQGNILNERAKDVLKLRLGLDGNKPCTLQEIGGRYNITRERVRQIGVSIERNAKKYFPEKKYIASRLFSKAWESKYLEREKRIRRRHAIIKRNKTIVKNRCKKLALLIDEFSRTRLGKDEIKKIFKWLRIKYRKNKSLFEPETVIEIKNLRLRYKEIRKGTSPTDQAPIS